MVEIKMKDVQRYVVKEFDKQFPGKGLLYEHELYSAVQEKISDRQGWDFYKFRQCYKQLFLSFMENILLDNSSFLLKLKNDEMNFKDAIRMDQRMWDPDKWPIFQDKPGEDEQEIREGTFLCGYCQRKGIYAKNTSHYEKQTRSADEPMTVFVHCHSCGRDKRFSS